MRTAVAGVNWIKSLESAAFPGANQTMSITETDPQIAELIRQEEKRQATTLELIA